MCFLDIKREAANLILKYLVRYPLSKDVGTWNEEDRRSLIEDPFTIVFPCPIPMRNNRNYSDTAYSLVGEETALLGSSSQDSIKSYKKRDIPNPGIVKSSMPRVWKESSNPRLPISQQYIFPSLEICVRQEMEMGKLRLLSSSLVISSLPLTLHGLWINFTRPRNFTEPTVELVIRKPAIKRCMFSLAPILPREMIRPSPFETGPLLLPRRKGLT